MQSNSDAFSKPKLDPNASSYLYANGHTYTHGNSYRHGYGNCNAYSEAYSNSKTQPGTKISSHPRPSAVGCASENILTLFFGPGHSYVRPVFSRSRHGCLYRRRRPF